MRKMKNTTEIAGFKSATLLDLCENLERIAEPQFDFAYEQFKNLIPTEVLKKIDKIIVSGCGDSYVAAAEAREAFKKYVPHVTMLAPSIIEATRYLELEEHEPNTLIVAVSASGSPARVAELLERGKQHGCVTVSLTNKPESRAAGLADYVYLTNTPSDSPGLGSYYASLLSLIVMSAVMGEVVTERTGLVTILREKLLDYNKAFFEDFDTMVEITYQTASKWVDLNGFEVIADGPLFPSAQFIAAKYAEAAGVLCSVVDSENYWHVNGISKTQGTLIMGVSDEPNIERLVATTNRVAENDKRPALFISDKPAKDLGISDEVIDCVIKVPEVDYRFLLLLYVFVPGSLMVGYHASLTDEPYFRGFPEIFKKPGVFTTVNSKIEII